jgi:hypothetical protein
MMSETTEELLNGLREQLGKPVDELLDSQSKRYVVTRDLFLDPKRRETLTARVATEVQYVRDAVEAGGYVLALVGINRLMELCRNEYRLNTGGKSTEIDSLSQWLIPVASFLNELIEQGKKE